GVRPLVRAGGGNTAALARDHALRIDVPGLVTITGGKWTTYRSMAEGCVDKAAAVAGLPRRRCPTAEMRLHGYDPAAGAGSLAVYGSDAAAGRQVMGSHPPPARPMPPALPYTRAGGGWAGPPGVGRPRAARAARPARGRLP